VSTLGTLAIIGLAALAWGVAGLLYHRRVGADGGDRRLVILPLFLMIRLPHGFRYFERYRGSRLSRLYARFSIASGILSLAVFYLLVGQGIYAKYLAPAGPSGGAAGFVPIIPFVTIKGPLLAYILFAIGVGALVHELSHAFAARTSGVPVKSGGFVLLAFIPAAFVEPDEESLRKASLGKRAYVYTAGPAANVLVALVAIALLYGGLASPPHGICVIGVDQGMPADKAGLKPGDLIVAVNGIPVTEENFSKAYDPIPPDKNFTLTIRRGGGTFNVTVWKEETSSGQALMGVKVQPGPFCDTVYMVLFTMYWINLSLAVINMAPLFITDGGRLLTDFLEERRVSRTASHAIQALHLLVFLSLLTIP